MADRGSSPLPPPRGTTRRACATATATAKDTNNDETILRHYDCTFLGNLFCIFTGAGDNRISNSNAHKPLSSSQSYDVAEPVAVDLAQIAASSRPAARHRARTRPLSASFSGPDQ